MAGKIIFYIMVGLIMPLRAHCQGEQLIINLTPSTNKRLFKFENSKGSIKVIGYDGNDIVINADFRFNAAESSDASGLKNITADKIDISAENDGSTVTLFNRTDAKTIDFNIKIPENFSLNLNTLDNGIVEVINVDGEIEIENSNGDISLENISGSSVLSTVYGRISATFREVKQGNPMMFTSFEGDISIYLPVNANAILKMKTGSGEIRTDFDLFPVKRKPVIKRNEKGTVYSLEDWVTGQINKGGPEYIIRSFSGNITIKKWNSGNF
jgi:hypothetical protein